MGYFFEGFSLATIFGVILLIAALIVINEISRKTKLTSIITYIAIPAVLFTLLALGILGSPSGNDWFGVVKAISALTGVLGFMYIRYKENCNKKFTAIFPMAILSINILEAVYKEFEVFANYKTPVMDEAAGLYLQGGTWNILNAISGILVIVTLTGWVGIRVAKTKTKDMIWADQLWFWIIAYDLWNVAYCYNCLSTRSMYAGVVLIVACTIIELFICHGGWLQHRAQTLAIFALFSICVDYTSLSMFSIESSYNPNAMMVLSVITFVFCIGVTVYTAYKIIKTRRNPIKEELFTDLKEYKRNIKVNCLD